MRNGLYIFLEMLFLLCVSCEQEATTVVEQLPDREFNMGFTTWSFGPSIEAVEATYAFIGDHADIYVEHLDDKIPWSAWMTDSTLPDAFIKEIQGKAARKLEGKKLVLSIGMFNANRDDLESDFDGAVPEYESLIDSRIIDAYSKHVSYLVDAFSPDYLVISIEANEFRLRNPDQWNGYKAMIRQVTDRIKAAYRDLPVSQSVSLHNLYAPDIANLQDYHNEMIDFMNGMDFVAISYYPFLANHRTVEDFQLAFKFLHDHIDRPIAVVESGELAEHLLVPGLNVSISGDQEGQQLFLESMLSNAYAHDYEFVIWWAHRDFDALWEVFPPELKDLGQLWRDTGLLDEDGSERLAFSSWKAYLSN